MAEYDGTYQLGSTAAQVRANWYAARGAGCWRTRPTGSVGADEFDDTFLAGGYDDELWPGLAQALSAYLNGGQTSQS